MPKIYLVVALVVAVIYWSENTHRKPSQQPIAARGRVLSPFGSSTASIPANLKARLGLRRNSKSILLGGTILGRKYLPPSDSLLVFGPTRSGKTMTLALPLITGFHGPVVATSVKRDLYQMSHASRQARGECYIFDLSDPSCDP